MGFIKIWEFNFAQKHILLSVKMYSLRMVSLQRSVLSELFFYFKMFQLKKQSPDKLFKTFSANLLRHFSPKKVYCIVISKINIVHFNN